MTVVDLRRKINTQFDIESFNPEPGPYCMSFGFNIEPLRKSIQAVGLLNPPLLVKSDREGRMEVVSGYRRILACSALGWRFVTCFDISPAGLTAKEILLVSLFDNLANRELNLAEKGMLLQRLKLHFSDEQIRREYMPLLGLACRDSIFQDFLSLSEFSPEQLQSMIDHKISISIVGALRSLDDASRSLMMDSIINLNLNFNQQLQFIEFIIDISIMRNIKISKVLEKIETLKPENEPLNKPQKAKRIMETLRSMRYPRLTKAEQVFEQQVRNLNLPKGARILHSPGFEAEYCQLTIDFRSGHELKNKALAVAGLTDLEKLLVFRNKE